MANLAQRIDVGEKAKHRKIDVDAYDEDRFIDEEGVDNSADSQVTARANEVQGLIQKGNAKEAVLKSLDNPPLSASQAVKVRILYMFLFILFLFIDCDLNLSVFLYIDIFLFQFQFQFQFINFISKASSSLIPFKI